MGYKTSTIYTFLPVETNLSVFLMSPRETHWWHHYRIVHQTTTITAQYIDGGQLNISTMDGNEFTQNFIMTLSPAVPFARPCKQVDNN